MKKLVVVLVVNISMAVLVIGAVMFYKFNHLGENLWFAGDVKIETDEYDNGYMVVNNYGELETDDQEFQDLVETKIGWLKKFRKFTLDQPLLILNPYGTNTTGMYIYFSSKKDVTIEYTIAVEGYADYSNTLFNTETSTTKQEGQIIGLLQGETNIIYLDAKNKDGEIVDSQVLEVTIPYFNTISSPVLMMEEQGNVKELENGLYCIFGYDRLNSSEKKHLLFYDNSGIIRAEIPLEVVRADVNIKMIHHSIFYAQTDSSFYMVNPLGKIEREYFINGYTTHHDFDYDGDHKVLVLANKNSKDTEEDIILTIDLDTGKVTETIDFEDLMQDIRNRATLPNRDTKLDWIHFNTIDVINGTDMLLSSRELSTIIRVNDIYTNPTIEYMIADEWIWDGTKYEDLLLTKLGDFPSQAGQHTVTYAEEETLGDGMYYIYMFNNNYGYSSTMPKYDWTQIPEIGTVKEDADHSMYYKYLVDEKNKTYKLVRSIKVPYSSIVSSTQEIGNNVVVCSGKDVSFSEYNIYGDLVARFRIDTENFTYRVFKYTMEDFWFAK